MNKIFHIIMALGLLIMATACGSNEDFAITGTLEGVDSQTVIATYYSNGGLKQVPTACVEGKFALRGSSERPTMVVLTLSDGTPIATLVAANGDEISIKGSLEQLPAVEVGGSATSKAIAGWLTENVEALRQGNAAEINSAVRTYIENHKNDLASTAILVNYFRTEGYEATADSLFSIIASSARPVEIVQGFNTVVAAQLAQGAKSPITFMTIYDSSDSTVSINPYSQTAVLLCFMPNERAARDSVAPRLRRLTDRYSGRRFMGVELSCAPDSDSWRRSIGTDSVKWVRAWLPGSVSASSVRKLAVPRIPYFIVADSTGQQIYRGSSIAAAQRTVEDLVGKHAAKPDSTSAREALLP